LSLKGPFDIQPVFWPGSERFMDYKIFCRAGAQVYSRKILELRGAIDTLILKGKSAECDIDSDTRIGAQ